MKELIRDDRYEAWGQTHPRAVVDSSGTKLSGYVCYGVKKCDRAVPSTGSQHKSRILGVRSKKC